MQADEERTHAKLINDFLLSSGIDLYTLGRETEEASSRRKLLDDSIGEIGTTKATVLENSLKMALDSNRAFLQKLRTFSTRPSKIKIITLRENYMRGLAEEQLEEEEKFGELVKQMEMFEGNLALILDFDKRLGEGASH